jgi:hypothetical protein
MGESSSNPENGSRSPGVERALRLLIIDVAEVVDAL